MNDSRRKYFKNGTLPALCAFYMGYRFNPEIAVAQDTIKRDSRGYPMYHVVLERKDDVFEYRMTLGPDDPEPFAEQIVNPGQVKVLELAQQVTDAYLGVLKVSPTADVEKLSQPYDGLADQLVALSSSLNGITRLEGHALRLREAAALAGEDLSTPGPVKEQLDEAAAACAAMSAAVDAEYQEALQIATKLQEQYNTLVAEHERVESEEDLNYELEVGRRDLRTVLSQGEFSPNAATVGFIMNENVQKYMNRGTLSALCAVNMGHSFNPEIAVERDRETRNDKGQLMYHIVLVRKGDVYEYRHTLGPNEMAPATVQISDPDQVKVLDLAKQVADMYRGSLKMSDGSGAEELTQAYSEVVGRLLDLSGSLNSTARLEGHALRLREVAARANVDVSAPGPVKEQLDEVAEASKKIPAAVEVAYQAALQSSAKLQVQFNALSAEYDRREKEKEKQEREKEMREQERELKEELERGRRALEGVLSQGEPELSQAKERIARLRTAKPAADDSNSKGVTGP